MDEIAPPNRTPYGGGGPIAVEGVSQRQCSIQPVEGATISPQDQHRKLYSKRCIRDGPAPGSEPKKHINFFNINFLAPTQNPNFGRPEKKLCASFPGKGRQKGTHIKGFWGSNTGAQTRGPKRAIFGHKKFSLLFFSLSLPRKRTGAGNRNRQNRFSRNRIRKLERSELLFRNRNRNRPFLLNCTETQKPPFPTLSFFSLQDVFEESKQNLKNTKNSSHRAKP